MKIKMILSSKTRNDPMSRMEKSVLPQDRMYLVIFAINGTRQ